MNEVSPEMQRVLDHTYGKHVVVEYRYADGSGVVGLLKDERAEAEAWQDAAFTNGPPLVEIRIRWDQKIADEIRKTESESLQNPAQV